MKSVLVTEKNFSGYACEFSKVLKDEFGLEVDEKVAGELFLKVLSSPGKVVENDLNEKLNLLDKSKDEKLDVLIEHLQSLLLKSNMNFIQIDFNENGDNIVPGVFSFSKPVGEDVPKDVLEFKEMYFWEIASLVSDCDDVIVVHKDKAILSLRHGARVVCKNASQSVEKPKGKIR